MLKLSGKTPRCCETPQVNCMSVLVWNYASGQGKGQQHSLQVMGTAQTHCPWAQSLLFGVLGTSASACTRPPLHPKPAAHFSKWRPAVARSVLPEKDWALWGVPDTRTVSDLSMQEKLLRKKRQARIVAPTYSHCHLGAGHRTSSLRAD